MKKIWLLSISIFLLTATAQADSVSINFFNRVGFGDANIWDGDENGNTNVWAYRYTTINNFDSSTYGYLNHIYQPYGYNRINNESLGKFPYHEERDGVMNFHTSESYALMLQFRSPYSADYVLNFQTQLRSGSTNGVRCFVQLNNEQVFEDQYTLYSGQTYSNSLSFTLNEGESLYLIIDPNGGYDWDHTYIQSFSLNGETIAQEPEEPEGPAVPEPCSMVLLSIGALSLFRRIKF